MSPKQRASTRVVSTSTVVKRTTRKTTQETTKIAAVALLVDEEENWEREEQVETLKTVSVVEKEPETGETAMEETVRVTRVGGKHPPATPNKGKKEVVVVEKRDEQLVKKSEAEKKYEQQEKKFEEESSDVTREKTGGEKVTSGNRAKKTGSGKRRRRRRRNMEVGEDYKRYIYKVLKQIHPGMGVSSKTMAVLNGFMSDMFERLAGEAARLSMYTGRRTLSSREFQGAVQLVIPGELGKHAIAEGTKAVSNYLSNR